VNYTEPAFSPNGKTIAFRAPNGTYTIPATGSHKPAKASSYTGLAAYRR
jgi:phosphosulfolactate phosphohydrolase-like enzyme